MSQMLCVSVLSQAGNRIAAGDVQHGDDGNIPSLGEDQGKTLPTTFLMHFWATEHGRTGSYRAWSALCAFLSLGVRHNTQYLARARARLCYTHQSAKTPLVLASIKTSAW